MVKARNMLLSRIVAPHFQGKGEIHVSNHNSFGNSKFPENGGDGEKSSEFLPVFHAFLLVPFVVVFFFPLSIFHQSG